jgi:hypothetical protein
MWCLVRRRDTKSNDGRGGMSARHVIATDYVNQQSQFQNMHL